MISTTGVLEDPGLRHRQGSSHAGADQTDSMIGTPNYMSPEQFVTQNASTNAATSSRLAPYSTSFSLTSRRSQATSLRR